MSAGKPSAPSLLIKTKNHDACSGQGVNGALFPNININQLTNSVIDVIPLQPLSQVPAAISPSLESQYFYLDLAKGQAMLAAGTWALYVPGALPDIKLGLFAVLCA